MDKRTKGCLLIAIGVILLIAVVGIAIVGGAGYWFYRQFEIQTAQHAPQDAVREMDAARARFGSMEPFLIFDGDEPRIRAGVAVPPPGLAKPIKSLHVMAFDAADGNFVRLSIPFWLVRLMPEGTLISGKDSLRLKVSKIESLGPGLLVDERKPDGSRVLVWTE